MRLAPFAVALCLPWTLSGPGAAAERRVPRARDEAAFGPRPLQAEVGQLLGVLFPSPRHNFQDERRSHARLNPVALVAGARAAFLPLTWLGVEADAAVAPSSTEDGRGATLWSARAHLLGQLPCGRWAAFVLVGGGSMGLRSDLLDDDADPLIDLGAGVKYAVGPIVIARLDLRDGLTQRNAAEAGALTHHLELTLGFSYRLPRTRPGTERDAASAAAAERDPDLDGIGAPRDRCPELRGVAPDGCPPDGDADGVRDDLDRCPRQAGSDRAGCPPDADGDGVTIDEDRCPAEAETMNGYLDADGCADRLPEGGKYLSFSVSESASWVGALEGVEFEPGSDALRPSSQAALDELARVLEADAAMRVRITLREREPKQSAASEALAARRAEALVALLVSRGIDRARIEAVGVAAGLGGPGTPAAPAILIEPLPSAPRR